MFRHLFGLVLMLLPLLATSAQADSRQPAAFVVSVELAGADIASGTSVVRAGGELPARIMMPLYAGDVVFVRDPRSRIEVEGDDGDVMVVDGEAMRRDISGEIDAGDGVWGVLTSIGTVIGGSSELPADNMVSKGGSPMVPLAIRGTNLLPPARTALWLPWTGGTAPFDVVLDAGAGERVLAQGVAGQEATLDLPPGLAGRFSLTIRDQQGQKAVVRFGRGETVPMPERPVRGGKLGELAYAAWLAGQSSGAWTIEAVQLLHQARSPAADAVIRHLVATPRPSRY